VSSCELSLPEPYGNCAIFAEENGPSLQDELRKTNEVAKSTDVANQEAVRKIWIFKYLYIIL
jgi:hypothetical protein